MTDVPDRPSIYHITHLDNLAGILTDGGLLSDAAMIAKGGPDAAIGMSTIKRSRLTLPVKCNQDDMVGDCVPFYFCPRSIMLFVIFKANHPDLTYRGGQGPILHLELDLRETVEWAVSESKRWAFSLSNAAASYTKFRNRLDQLVEVNWDAVQSTDFRSTETHEAKQAEFLVTDFVPWHLIRRIGVRTTSVHERVRDIIGGSTDSLRIEVKPDWYF